jgi:hypothetical protein
VSLASQSLLIGRRKLATIKFLSDSTRFRSTRLACISTQHTDETAALVRFAAALTRPTMYREERDEYGWHSSRSGRYMHLSHKARLRVNFQFIGNSNEVSGCLPPDFDSRLASF